ncbi:MAG TPA: cytochrome P450 [Aggregatilineales bacterium]|nr:cytochrome P450 [Aggregatilineales bacterium]
MRLATRLVDGRPPGPRGAPLIGNTLQFALAPLEFPRQCLADYGEIVYLEVRGLKTFLVVDPDAIETVLVTNHGNFILDRLSKGLSDALGNSLLVSDGGHWERQRRLVQPAFHKSRIESYAATMIRFAEQQIADWESGQVVDIFQEMSQVMLNIVASTLIGYDVTGRRAVIDHYLKTAMRYVLGIAGTGLRLPLRFPTPANLACVRAGEKLDDVIFDLIRERRRHDSDNGDLLSMLLLARDEDGQPMSEQDIRDEIVTMILVGHETSALALTFSFWLLANHPAAFQKLGAEIDEVLGGRTVTAGDLSRLRYGDWVLNEVLRLYPPVWAMGREAIETCAVGGYVFPAGSQILLSPWVSHRNPNYFDDPDQFSPERWATADKLPRYAYFPFGGGPRLCLGNRYARMEALVILATIAQRFTFSAVPGQQLDLLPTITLRPRHRLKLTVEARPKNGI